MRLRPYFLWDGNRGRFGRALHKMFSIYSSFKQHTQPLCGEAYEGGRHFREDDGISSVT